MSAAEALSPAEETTENSSNKESQDDVVSAKEDSDDSAVHSGDDEAEKSTGSPMVVLDEHSADATRGNRIMGSNMPESEKSEKDKEEKQAIKVQDTNDVLFTPENLISLTIIPPNAKSFEVQVSPQEIVQELLHLLMDYETTCHRTCFSLQLDGVKMDNFTELKNIPNVKNRSEVRIVEEPYSLREAKFHLRHVREMLNALENEESHLGTEGHSLSYLNFVTQTDVSKEAATMADSSTSMPSSPSLSNQAQSSSRSNSPNNSKKNIRTKSDSDSSEEGKANANIKSHRYKNLLSQLPKQLDLVACKPPDYVLPGSKETSLAPMHPDTPYKIKQCLKVITMSVWNPPPRNRKLHGDLLYIYVITLEDKHFHITSSSRGFFVNKSDQANFDPKPDSFTPPSHSLIDLLTDLSPGFRTNFPILNKARCARHIFERVGTPFQLHAWSTPPQKHGVNHIHAEDFLSIRNLSDENIPGQASRDWNEELAATREMPKSNLPERLLRERAMFKAHCDFVAAATRGAVMVVDGNIMPINPGEDKKMQMFIWNNIFFSLGFDVKDHYKDLGGNHAAFYAPLADLNGLCAYQAVDAEGLHLLGTAVIDYRGFRVAAQTIIPGILEKEQEQSIVHGSIDFGKNVLFNPEYAELIEKVAKPLRQLKHSVVSGQGESSQVVEVQTSVECKGITGNDGRHYLLDLLRTFPPDANFLKFDGEEPEKLLETCTKLGYPKKHRHSLATLRPELVEAFAEQKYVEFMQSCATQIFAMRSMEHANQAEKTLGLADGKSSVSGEHATSSHDSSEASTGHLHRSIVKEAARKAGSCTDSEFDLRFNPDLFTKSIASADSEEDVKTQKSLIKEAAEFLVAVQIPNFVRECALQAVLPVDGQSLVDAMHERGIGVRYLGKMVQILPESNQLLYFKRICITETYSRCIKHILRGYLQSVLQADICSSIVHFLNCLFSPSKSTPTLLEHEVSNKKKRRNRRVKEQRSDWNKLTPQTLWTQIVDEAKEYFDLDADAKSAEEFFDKHKISRLAMLRSICMKNGIKVLAREYDFEKRNKPTFNEDDIVDVFPLVKHSPPRASDAYHFFASGQVKIQQGCIAPAVEYITESLSLFNNVYGAMHLEIGSCYRSIARLQYIAGDHAEAVINQQKAVIMFERVLGVDHASTMFVYVNLAIYCFANSQIQSSLKLLYRARYLMNTMYGDDHPDMAQINGTIGLVLHGIQDYDLSLSYLLEALRINAFIGKENLKLALSYHLVARAYACKGNFRQALANEKQTFKMYQALLGVDHDKTKDSAEFLRHLTQQAVNLQRTMNEIYKKGSRAAIPPLQILPPNLGSVADMINAINGIVRSFIEPAVKTKSEPMQAVIVDPAEHAPTKGTDAAVTEKVRVAGQGVAEAVTAEDSMKA